MSEHQRQDQVERDKVHVACAVCGRICDYDTGAEAFVHGAAIPDDHPVVAVTVDELGWQQVIVRCDFCGQDHKHSEIWTVPAASFDEPRLPGSRPHRSVGDWAACRECAHLVRTGRWPDLVTRVLTTHNLPTTPGPAREWISELYHLVNEHLEGPPYRGTTEKRR